MSWTGRRIGDWRGFVDWVEGLGATRKSHMFRGQPQDYGNLKPRYLRLLQLHGITDRIVAHYLENDLLHTFFRTAPLHLDEAPVRAVAQAPPMALILNRWAIMQHYGAPTRVLDWTGSPFVAAFFAVEKDLDRDGEVWCYREAALENVWKAALERKEMDDWPARMEYPEYEKRRCIDGKPVLHHFILGMQTTRMASRQGVFTVSTDVFSDHAELLRDFLGGGEEGKSYHRVLIPSHCKLEFLSQLRLMNVTGASLFPGIDGVGRSVTEWAHLRAGAHG